MTVVLLATSPWWGALKWLMLCETMIDIVHHDQTCCAPVKRTYLDEEKKLDNRIHRLHIQQQQPRKNRRGMIS